LAIWFSKADTTAAQGIDDIVNHVAAIPELVLRSLVFGLWSGADRKDAGYNPAAGRQKEESWNFGRAHERQISWRSIIY
jgi:hypothetical protein